MIILDVCSYSNWIFIARMATEIHIYFIGVSNEKWPLTRYVMQFVWEDLMIPKKSNERILTKDSQRENQAVNRRWSVTCLFALFRDLSINIKHTNVNIRLSPVYDIDRCEKQWSITISARVCEEESCVSYRLFLLPSRRQKNNNKPIIYEKKEKRRENGDHNCITIHRWNCSKCVHRGTCE